MVEEGLPSNFLIPEQWNYNTDTSIVVSNWYQSFSDPKLNMLIQSALDSVNPSIIYNLARIEASESRVIITSAGKKVFVDYTGGYVGDFSSSNSTNFNSGYAVAPISWEADLWGEISAGMLAADESMLAELLEYDFTRQTIAATVCRLYFQIGTLNNSIALGKEFLLLNNKLLGILEERERIGVTNLQEVHLTKANIKSIESLLVEFENQLQLNMRQLELILGNYPDAVLSVNWKPQHLDTVISIGEPFELITRRPDLRASEARFRSAFYITEQTRLTKYPSLVLSADPGLSTSGGLIAGMSASLFGPIFNGKLIDAQITEATAYQRQAMANYTNSVMTAFKEVESAMSSEQILRQRYHLLEEAAQEYEKAFNLTKEQYIVGQIDLYYLLLIQSQWLGQELSLIELQRDIYIQRVQLYLSLGGSIDNLE
ncbi:MAG: TolC family protein [Reichenbachiella sp.]